MDIFIKKINKEIVGANNNAKIMQLLFDKQQTNKAKELAFDVLGENGDDDERPTGKQLFQTNRAGMEDALIAEAEEEGATVEVIGDDTDPKLAIDSELYGDEDLDDLDLDELDFDDEEEDWEPDDEAEDD